MRKFFLTLIISFFYVNSSFGSWKEVSCDQLSIQYLNDNFTPTYCSKIFDQGVHGNYMLLENYSTGESIEIAASKKPKFLAGKQLKELIKSTV